MPVGWADRTDPAYRALTCLYDRPRTGPGRTAASARFACYAWDPATAGPGRGRVSGQARRAGFQAAPPWRAPSGPSPSPGPSGLYTPSLSPPAPRARARPVHPDASGGRRRARGAPPAPAGACPPGAALSAPDGGGGKVPAAARAGIPPPGVRRAATGSPRPLPIGYGNNAERPAPMTHVSPGGLTESGRG